MLKTVLLTGADGFIGRHAVPLLRDSGYTVHAVSLLPSPEKKPEAGIIWHQCDLLDIKRQRELFLEVRPSHLLHLAWITTPGEYWSSLDNFRWVEASLELILNFISNGGRRAVFAGTCAEYDWSSPAPYRETQTPANALSVYGVCKNSLHRMARALSMSGSLSYAWARVFFPFGPYEHPKRLVPTIIRALLKGESADCYNGGQKRDFIYVKDVASAFVALLDGGVEGPVNIACGKAISLRDFIGIITESLGHPELIRFGTGDACEKEPSLIEADISRLRGEVGWKPRYSLEDGLKETIDWWSACEAKEHRCV